jgi:hypothetical protein
MRKHTIPTELVLEQHDGLPDEGSWRPRWTGSLMR